ncbi:tail fiber protein [Escherichia coli]|nr:tail fiber protein [Escherichia coli]MCV0887588.1 tail fiber protein [Escherichia coli]HCJ5854264.1 tail fiber protein [Escherichia coli]
MSKIVRYQGDVRAFASDAQGMERTVFGGTNQADDLTSQITASFLRGWGIVGASEHPSLEDFNAAMYAMSQFIAYQHQMGVPEWHAEQEYHIGSICTHNGESYQSLQNANIGSQPPSAKWTPVLTSKNGLANLGIKDASTTQVGLVRLTSSRVSGAEDIAATANAVAQNYTDIKSLQNKTQDSTTTQKGIVQLTSSRVSESETLAATAKAAAMNYADIVALQGKTNDATTTNKGIIRVSDSRTSTESGVAASSLAASQNYSDMKGLFGQCGMKSRNLGVVYTNSQSFAIFVSVNAVLSDGSSFLSANVNVDGNSANFRGSQTTNLAGQRATIAFMVPAGATYIVQQFSGTVSDVTWVEVDKK